MVESLIHDHSDADYVLLEGIKLLRVHLDLIKFCKHHSYQKDVVLN